MTAFVRCSAPISEEDMCRCRFRFGRLTVEAKASLSPDTEQFSLAVVEAMASVFPVVSTDVVDLHQKLRTQNLPFLDDCNDETKMEWLSPGWRLTRYWEKG
ncbi:hypothetical protein [Sphingorhabdus sp.]|uniref:hypothetical protein n=1 Tax=Sphingorhabdus sp. TaxID=1902408 RepID=UPI003BAEDF73|nr:hypothetical protein [Sphingomonadales bacterium]